MTVSLNRQQVDEWLEKRGTDLATFVEAGRQEGKGMREIASDLRYITGVPFSTRSLYRWAETLEEAS